MQSKLNRRLVKPMLAKLSAEPFDNPNWIFEVKWDGYRAIAEIKKGNVELYSRNALSFNERFRSIVASLKKIKKNMILDGEVVALKKGRPDFHALQDHEQSKAPLVYCIFDLLSLDGKSMEKKTLRERREILKKNFPKAPNLLFSEGVVGQGKAYFKQVKRQKLEGMIGKNLESVYEEGKRSGNWQKFKSFQAQEAIVLGFTEPRGSRKYIGALVLGAYEGKELKYIGHSGGGFTQVELKELHQKLLKIKTSTAPIKEKVPVNSPITWVKPIYVCEAEFSEWTPDNRMRHPIYAGLRVDKKPKEVIIER